MTKKLFKRLKFLNRFDIYDKNYEEICKKNRRRISTSIIFFIFILLIILAFASSFEVLKKARLFYLSGVISLLIILLLTKIFKIFFAKHTLIISYFFWDLCYLYLLYISVMIFNNSTSLSVILFFTFSALLMTDKYYRQLINSFVLFLIFIVASKIYKDSSFFFMDAVNVFLFYVVGTFTGLINLEIRLKDYENRNLLEVERDECSFMSFDLNIALETQKICSDVIMKIQHETTSKVISGEILNDVFEKLRKIFDADRAFLFSVKGKKLRLSNLSTRNKKDKNYFVNTDYDNYVDHLQLERLKNGKNIYVSDKAKIKEKHPKLYQVMLEKDISRVMFEPVIRDGNLVAICGLDNPSIECGDSLVNSLKTVSFVISDLIGIVENRILMQKITYTDYLSKLGNRNAYEKKIKELDKTQGFETVGVIFLDLDDLKTSNDKHGHEYGDKLISEIGILMREKFDKDVTFRIGGDEFVTILSNYSYKKFMMLVNELKQEIQMSKIVSASIGFSYGSNNESLEVLVKKADENMYEEKQLHHTKKPT